jgi:hypothetical protein
VPPYVAAVLASEPAVYWRLGELCGPHAVNAVDGRNLGTFETQIAYYMPGPQAPDFPGLGRDNRGPHFVGQRLSAAVPGLGQAYTVEMWFYNCMPTDARAATGYLFSRGPAGDHLAIGGTECSPGKLVFHTGDDWSKAHAGSTGVPLRNWVSRDSWHHVALVRDGAAVTVYLDGRLDPELSARTGAPPESGMIWIGGRNDGQFGFEGRIDEVAVYPRALTGQEISKHYQAAF